MERSIAREERRTGRNVRVGGLRIPMPLRIRPAAFRVPRQARALIPAPGRARAKAKAKAAAKAKAKALGSRRRRKSDTCPGGKTPLGWQPLENLTGNVGQEVHFKRTYQGVARECVGEVEKFLEDRDTTGLTGIPHESLREWRKSHNDEFYVNRKPLLKSVDAGVEGVFVATEFREVEPSPEWKSKCIDLSYPREGLPALSAVAKELGYGLDGAGVGAFDAGPAKGTKS